MERKYLQNLENWYNDPFRKPMLIYGARQVGKTTLIKDIFAKKYFQKVIYICSNSSSYPFARASFSTNDRKITSLGSEME